MPAARHPELRAFLASFHGKQTRVYLNSGQVTTGIVNTTTWTDAGPTSIYLVSTDDQDLAAVLIPWHSIAALGKLLPDRPTARGDEPRRAPELGDSGQIPPIPPIPTEPLTSEQADTLIGALRIDNPDPLETAR